MKAVILAGGFGTRISEETHLKPKPMVEIQGRPILWHIMKIYSFYGVKEFIDVHLMIDPVDELAQSFIKAGADLVSFHPEASKHVHRSIHAIKDQGCKAGLVFNPASSLNVLENVIEDLDLVLIMSVNPGFGGQSFIHSSLEKISQVRKMIDATGKDIRLEVDGGINNETIGLASEAGADTFVAGSAIFNTDNYEQTIKTLRSKII